MATTKMITSEVRSDLVVEENTYLRSIVHGNVVVLKSRSLELHGAVSGNLFLETDAQVYLHGVVDGDVINEGGHLAVFGIVKGSIVDKGGKTFVSAQATIGGGG